MRISRIKSHKRKRNYFSIKFELKGLTVTVFGSALSTDPRLTPSGRLVNNNTYASMKPVDTVSSIKLVMFNINGNVRNGITQPSFSK